MKPLLWQCEIICHSGRNPSSTSLVGTASKLPPSLDISTRFNKFNKANLNTQHRILFTPRPYSLFKQCGAPLSNKLRCCAGTVTSRSIVKLHLCCTLGRNPGSPDCARVSLLMRRRLAGKPDHNDKHGCFSVLSHQQ